jgi:AraC-like DNA-binding protein
MAERLYLRLPEDPCYSPETSVPPGTLRELGLPLSLRPFVASAMTYRETLPPGVSVSERVLPDGAVRLIFEGGDEIAARVAGATTQPVLLELRGRLQGLSVALRPGAVAAVLGVPAAELAGRDVAMEDMPRPWAAALAARLRDAPDDATRASVLASALRRQLAASEGTHAAARQAAYAARIIEASGGCRGVREVAEAAGMGERRLQQVFREHVGLSPRAYARLARLHACLRALRHAHPPRWAELAVEAGFYDQAHLANEFRALCGLSPTEFLARRVSASSKTAPRPPAIVRA